MSVDSLIASTAGLRFHGRSFPCAIGRGGITSDKHEGDGASPVGTHHIVGMFYRPDRVAAPNDWAIPLRLGDLWSDDPNDSAYNSLVRAPYPHSHEILRRADPLYDLILITDWNYPHAIPGKGSAIFMHIWRKPRHPTEGCIALDRRDLTWIAERLRPGAPLVIKR